MATDTCLPTPPADTVTAFTGMRLSPDPDQDLGRRHRQPDSRHVPGSAHRRRHDRRLRQYHAAQAITPQARADVDGSGTIASTRTIPSFVPW